MIAMNILKFYHEGYVRARRHDALVSNTYTDQRFGDFEIPLELRTTCGEGNLALGFLSRRTQLGF